MPNRYCAKIYGISGMTVKHGIHLAGGVSIIDPEGLSVFAVADPGFPYGGGGGANL